MLARLGVAPCQQLPNGLSLVLGEQLQQRCGRCRINMKVNSISRARSKDYSTAPLASSSGLGLACRTTTRLKFVAARPGARTRLQSTCLSAMERAFWLPREATLNG